MLPEQLEVFLETAEALNFTDVAKRRYTTQPTISRQICALEREWDLTLFERSNKGLRLTAAGAIMARTCKRMRQQIDTGLKQARNLNFGKGDRLRLGFLNAMDTERIFMPWLRQFAQRFPELEISTMYGSFGALRDGLTRGTLDLIYTLGFDRVNFGNEIVYNELGTVRPVFAISDCHPLYSREHLTLADCAEELFFLPSSADAPGREADLQMILRAHGIAEGKIRFVPDLESALFQMQLGKGLALLDTGMRYYHSGRYRIIELSALQKELELISVWRRDNLNPFLSLLTNTQTVELEA